MARNVLRQTFQDPVTLTYATLSAAQQADGLAPGLIRYEDDGTTNGLKKYIFMATNGAFTQYQAGSLYLTDTNLQTLIASSAAGQNVIGIAQVAITSGYYGWFQCGGAMSAIVKTGVSAGDPLTATTTAGALGQATEAGSGAYKHVAAIAAVANSSGGDLTKVVYMKM
jgi:hypothetical protein